MLESQCLWCVLHRQLVVDWSMIYALMLLLSWPVHADIVWLLTNRPAFISHAELQSCLLEPSMVDCVKELPWVKSVAVRYQLANVRQLELQTRLPVARFGQALVDEDGVIFISQLQVALPLPRVIVSENRVAEAIAILNALGPSVRTQVQTISLTHDQWQVHSKSQLFKLGSAGVEAAKRARHFFSKQPRLLQHQGHYFDFRSMQHVAVDTL